MAESKDSSQFSPSAMTLFQAVQGMDTFHCDSADNEKQNVSESISFMGEWYTPEVSTYSSSSPSSADLHKPLDNLFDKFTDIFRSKSSLHDISNPHDLMKELEKPGIDPNARDPYHNAPVHSIVKKKMSGKKKVELLEVLFSYSDANVDLQGPEGNTALHFAALESDIHAAMALLAFGAKVNVLNTYHHTPFDLVPRPTRFLYRQDSTPSLVMIDTLGLEEFAESSSDSIQSVPSDDNVSKPSDTVKASQSTTVHMGTVDTDVPQHFVEELTQLFQLVGAYRGDQVKFIKEKVTVPPFIDLLGDAFYEKEADSAQPCLKPTPGDNWPAQLTTRYRELHRSIEQRLEKIEMPLTRFPDEAMSLAVQLREMRMYKKAGSRMLFLDGGGIRGLIQIEILRQIESETGRKITELFDWIVGTSTGGVVALALVYAKKSLSDVRKFYFRLKNEIFGSAHFGLAYNTEALEKIIREELGDICMYDVKYPRVVVLAVNKGTTPLKLNYFNNCFDDAYSTQPVWKVARYSCAAPMFFHEFEDYVDGGVLANNPCESGLTRIQDFYRSRGKKLPISLVVSVGTGTYPEEKLGSIDVRDYLHLGMHWITSVGDGLTSRAHNFISLLSTALGESETIAANSRSRCLEQGIPYYRFNPKLSENVSSGETDTEKLVDMLVRTRAYISSQSNFNELIVQFHNLANANRKMYHRITAV